MSKAEQYAESVAKELLDIETLKVRNLDRFYFYDCGVGSIKAALIKMYELGQKEQVKLDNQNIKNKRTNAAKSVASRASNEERRLANLAKKEIV